MQPGKAGHPYKPGTARCKSCNGIGVAPCPLCGGTEVTLRAADPDNGPRKDEEEDEVSLLEWLAQFKWGQLPLQLHLRSQKMTYQVMHLRTTRVVTMWLALPAISDCDTYLLLCWALLHNCNVVRSWMDAIQTILPMPTQIFCSLFDPRLLHSAFQGYTHRSIHRYCLSKVFYLSVKVLCLDDLSNESWKG